MICKVCNSHNCNEVITKDITTSTPFIYIQCNSCGVLALVSIPDDYGSYYSNSYYSFNPPEGIVKIMKRLRDSYELTGKGFFGSIITLLQPNPNFKSIRLLNLSKPSRLLDIGCGAGNEIRQLNELGYSNVFGIDPFIKADILFNNKVLVAKKEVKEVQEKFDFITMHHSFEHVLNPLETLIKINDLLLNNGTLMIRIPVAGSFAFEKYGTSWVQLDAPRHVFLHTPKSMGILCSKAGLKIEKIIFDSTAFQFWGSKLVQKGNGIHTVGRWAVLMERVKSFFSGDHALSKKLNSESKGDQAIFIIKKYNKKLI